MKKLITTGAVTLLPMLAFAQGNYGNLENAMASVQRIINNLIPIVISIALVLFLVGIVKFVASGGDEEARASARNMMIFGIIALFVMMTVWGFVKILGSTFFGGSGIDPVTPPQAPVVLPIR